MKKYLNVFPSVFGRILAGCCVVILRNYTGYQTSLLSLSGDRAAGSISGSGIFCGCLKKGSLVSAVYGKRSHLSVFLWCWEDCCGWAFGRKSYDAFDEYGIRGLARRLPAFFPQGLFMYPLYCCFSLLCRWAKYWGRESGGKQITEHICFY